MNKSRRDLLAGAAVLAGGSALLSAPEVAEAAAAHADSRSPYVPVTVPNGATLPFKLENGVKVFQLTAEPVQREFAPGMVVNCWGYNGLTPGPVIEAVEGDRVRILVTNKLPEPTSIHWHGVLLPNGMDGVGGLTQPHIQPGETYQYEFTLRQTGTLMYHPHSDEMTQMALGMMGLFVIHPRGRVEPRVDRDFCIMLHEWAVPPGSATPDPSVMLDFNLFTFNSRVYPGTDALVVRKGERVRVRLGNLSMDSHPIHLHGFRFRVTGTDGGPIPAGGQIPETTISVPVGATRDIEFVADEPGDWVFHCHKSHHTMNQMGHGVPNMTGVKQAGVEKQVRALLPGYMAMGENGMHDMSEMGMALPKNTLPMMAGQGPYGPIGMGGMFTIIKVREGLGSYEDPGFYQHPAGTQPKRVG